MSGVGGAGSEGDCTTFEEDEMPFTGVCDPLAESFARDMAEGKEGPVSEDKTHTEAIGEVTPLLTVFVLAIRISYSGKALRLHCKPASGLVA